MAVPCRSIRAPSRLRPDTGWGLTRYCRWRECRSPWTGSFYACGTTGSRVVMAVAVELTSAWGGVVRSANILKRGLLLEAAATMRSRACCCDFSIACRCVDPPDHPSSTDERPIGE